MTVFIDSNIPMYVAGRPHPNREPSLRLLERVRSGAVEGVTSTGVLQEILFRYSTLGRMDLGYSVYDLFAQLCAKVLPVTLADTDRARAMLPALEGVSVRDAIHAAVMLTNGVTKIATFDQGFDRIPGVRRMKLD
ncbi:type II toxin-antitoxin system VapC family toxin [Acidobacteria bacterium ACD]|nr:MAG: PIN domain-containing protein [Acidobacteriota bacterium]MCE7956424.1 PIN domain-containing protein [Acidobacteria bacterium ACB2]MDL1950090.1 type II toxin-antitoxin system VapC family toxin [Acidobacteria bacterium ACD]